MSLGPARRVVSVNVGRIATLPGRRVLRSAIDKRPVDGPVGVGRLGLSGDVQAESQHHGGVDQAVYAYATEDMARWAERLDRPLRPGQFGENLSTAGIDITAACIGERWQVGSVLLEVADVRIPCATFQQWLGEPRWVRRFAAEGRPGAYLRVRTPGALQAGDDIVVTERPNSRLTVGVVFAALMHDRTLLPRLLTERRLAVAARRVAQQYVERAG